MATTTPDSRRALLSVVIGGVLILAVGVASFGLVGQQDDSFDDVAPVALRATDDVRPDDCYGNVRASPGRMATLLLATTIGETIDE